MRLTVNYANRVGITNMTHGWKSGTSEGFSVPDIRLTHEWAREHVSLVPPLTKTGPFDVSISRQLAGPLDALDDDHCREVNVKAPVRSGKTLIADVWLCSIIGRTP